MNKPPVAPDYNKLINTFIWRFFGVAFLIFVLFKMFGSIKESNQNKLGDHLDVSGEQIDQNLQKIERAVKPTSP